MHVYLHAAPVADKVHQKVIWKSKFIQMFFTAKQNITVYIL